MKITNRIPQRLTSAASLFLFQVIGAQAGDDRIYAVKPGDKLTDFAALRFDVPHIAVGEYRLALTPGQYYWRIANVAADGDQGPFSDLQGFVQRKVPDTFPTWVLLLFVPALFAL